MYKSCTERGEYHVVTLLETTFVVPQGERYRGSTRVAVVLDVHHHLLHREFQTLGYRLDDTHISLMRNDPLDIILVQAVTLGYQRTVVAHVRHCIAEHRAPLLIEVMQTMINREM